MRTQQAPLPLPDFDYALNGVASAQDALVRCARGLGAMGCDAVAQVGTPFAWAGTRSEAEARARLPGPGASP